MLKLMNNHISDTEDSTVTDDITPTNNNNYEKDIKDFYIPDLSTGNYLMLPYTNYTTSKMYSDDEDDEDDTMEYTYSNIDSIPMTNATFSTITTASSIATLSNDGNDGSNSINSINYNTSGMTEFDVFVKWGVFFSDQIKSVRDIWNEYHRINDMGYSFEKLDDLWSFKWKLYCQPKFVKKFNRRLIIIKKIKSAIKECNQDPEYSRDYFIEYLDSFLKINRKSISWFYIKSNLPPLKCGMCSDRTVSMS